MLVYYRPEAATFICNITFIIFMNSSFNEVVLKFYQQQSLRKSLVVSWIQALPLLHFLREESVPFEDLICAKPVDVKTWKWWGLGDFSYREIRGHIERFGLYICPVFLACVFSFYGLFTHALLSFGHPLLSARLWRFFPVLPLFALCLVVRVIKNWPI